MIKIDSFSFPSNWLPRRRAERAPLSTRRAARLAYAAYRDALKKPAPQTPEGIAFEMMRLILAAENRVPSRAEILDLCHECLRTVEGERQCAANLN